MERTSSLYTGRRKATTIEVEEEVLQKFRMAISKKHRGSIKGFTYIELNNALSTWTSVLNGEAVITPISTTPTFGGAMGKGNINQKG